MHGRPISKGTGLSRYDFVESCDTFNIRVREIILFQKLVTYCVALSLLKIRV